MVWIPLDKGGAILCRFFFEAAVEGREEGRQDLVGLVKGGSLSLTQGFDKTILERAEEAFNPPFGLRARGLDQINA
jgi:hypothetical protein